MKGLLCLFGRLVVGSILIVFFSSPGLAQPANDLCAGATVITHLPYHTTENTRLATPDPSDPSFECNNYGAGLDGKTVWFVWTADRTAWIRFSTVGSTPSDSFDTVIGLFTGTCGSLTEVACNDDSISGNVRQSVLYYYVQTGITYTVLVAEWNGGGISGGVPTGGNLVFDVAPGLPPPLVQGPRSGSVSHGAIATTGSYYATTMTQSGAPTIIKPFRPPVLYKSKGVIGVPKGPEGSNYIEDKGGRSVTALPASISRPVVQESFQGFYQDQYLPPDPNVAVGPSHVLAMVNSQARIFDKSGTVLKTLDLNSWFSNVKLPVNFTDPQVVYDHFAKRWVMVGIASDQGFIYLSISDDSIPLGTWYSWGLPGYLLGDSVTANFTDHPHLGYDSTALYITTREFGTTTRYSRVRIIGKGQLYANTAGPVAWTDLWDFRDPQNLTVEPDFMKPSISFGSPGVQFLVAASSFDPGAYFTLWTVHDPLGSPSVTAANIPVVLYSSPPSPNGLGGTGIPGFGTVIGHKPVYMDSSLWIAHSIASGSGKAYSAVHYVRINPFTHSNLEDMAMGRDGYWHFFPALVIDRSKNVMITYTRSGLTEYPGVYLCSRRATDPPGLSTSVLVKQGEAAYTQTRWGDYNGIGLDPAEPGAIWSMAEYAASPAQNWGTWIAKAKVGPLPGRIIYVDPLSYDFGNFELGHGSDTTKFAISNSGLDTLVISNISVPDTNFVIINPPTFPLSIATNDVESLEVAFTPKVAGNFNDTLTIASNDPAHPTISINLIGKCFFVTQAQPGVMYAGAGQDGGGEVLTVNMMSGAATMLGASGYSGILSARVNPSTNEIIGLVPSGQQEMFVRINSAGGDAHPLVTVSMPVVPKGMAFKNDTLYVGTLNGVIYKVDLNTGTAAQVVSTGLLLSGLDFNPVTGVLLASVQGGSMNDAIYKINLSTGTPTLVGRTGLRKPTQDIIFDASGNLFGIAGTSGGDNSFVVIDTLTGSATIIGSLGYSSVVCLAMAPSTKFFGNTYRLKASWNLLSVPVVKQNYSRAVLFPSSTTEAYGYDGQYKTYDTLDNGRGYWMKFASSQTFSMVGAADTLDTISVRQRWNIVGSLSVPLPVSKITSIPSNIIRSNFFSYDKDSGYMIASTIKPGLGYWVRVDSNGQLVLSPSMMIPKRSIVEQSIETLNKMNSLTIRANNGMAQTLYFGAAGTDAQTPEMFELPPPAPAGMLDARFSTNTILAAYDSKQSKTADLQILVQSPSFPVTVQWHIDHDMQLKYSLLFTKQKSSQVITQVMKGDGSVNLTGDQATNLRLQIASNVLPTQFALAQNYPNPFNPMTTIRYELPADSYVKLVVYDVLGREVVTLVDGQQQAGFYDATFSAAKVASGVYFYQLHAEAVDRAGGTQGFQSVRKMLLLK